MRGRGFRFGALATRTEKQTARRSFTADAGRVRMRNRQAEFEGGARMFERLKIACALILALGSTAFAADAPGVTATEIKIGSVFPFSGPASSIGLVGRGVLAY